jgi:hypothetical protein
MNFGQADTGSQSIIGDVRNIPRNRDAGQVGAAVKSAVTDRNQSIREGNAG